MRQGQQNRRGRGRGGRRTQNPLTRNFESNGPDVKIRGSASHIAEKYGSLARDAVSSGDPVTAENYFQHAEHYNRIIMAAQLQMQPNTEQPVETLNGADAAAPAQAKPNAALVGAELGTVATANSLPVEVAEKPAAPAAAKADSQTADLQTDGNKRRRRRTSGNGVENPADAPSSNAAKNEEKSAQPNKKSAQPNKNGAETPATEDVPPDGAVA